MYGQFLVIFALLFTGYFFRKIELISSAMNQGLNRFIVYFAFPCFIFHKVAGLDMSAELLSEFLIVFGLSVAFFLVYGMYAWGYGRIRKFPRAQAGSAEMVMIFPNNAFMGFPIAYLFFGDLGLLFMLANNIAMNLCIFSYGVFVLRRDDGGKRLSAGSMIKCVLNPNIIALVAGLLFCFLNIGLPEPADSYLVYVGSICTPMSMIYIGSTLVGSSLRKMIRKRIVVESVINKNIILPLFTYAVLVFVPLSGLISPILVFAACFPSAAVAALLVETEEKDSELACEILIVSTAVSIVTLPVAARLIHLFMI